MIDRAVNSDSTSPRFSVIIPAYNRERFIGECVRSALEQRYPAEEVIVVDDGSTDRTRQVVRDVPGASTVRYQNQENQGPSVARNYGASLAKGDWLAFLDADDVWKPDKLSIQAEYVRKHPEAAMFWCDVEYIDESGGALEPVDWKDRLSPLMFNRPMCPVPSVVILRKDVFALLGGFNPLMRCYEDGEFFMRVAAQFPIHFIDRVLVRYRCHPSQLHRNVRARATSWPFMYQLLAEHWRDDPAKQTTLLKVSASIHTYLGKHFLRAGNYREARRHFRLSYEQDPVSWTNLRRWGLSYFPPLRALYRHNKKHAVRV